jgi:hypothetical protein
MRRRRSLVLAGVVLALAVGIPAAIWFPGWYQRFARSQLIDREHCDRIKEGMSRAEVEAILGGGPGDYTTVTVAIPKETGTLFIHGEPASWHGGSYGRYHWEHWTGNEGQITVVLHDGETVSARWFTPNTLPPRSLVDQIRDWLRRLWR